MRTLRHTAGSLLRSPGFSIAAVLIITICLGANLTIFYIIDSVLLRPLPFPDADRLVTIFNTYPKAGVDRDGASLTNYYERRGQIAAMSSLAVFRPDTAIVGDVGATQRMDLARVSPDFFSTLGIEPVIGRSFHEEETTYETDSVIILTDAYWRKHFNGEPNVLGRDIRVDGIPKKVIGVLPRAFSFLSSNAALYVPYASGAELRLPKDRHSGNSITMVGRLKSGATLAEAQLQVDAHNASVAESYPQAKMIANAGFRSVVVSLHGDHVKSVRPILLLLQGGVLLLLLIGAVNLINLLLIRASGRSREMAIRLSMGATRWHVVLDATMETALLTAIGAGGAVLLAAFGVEFITTFGAERLPLGAEIVFDARVAFVALVGAIGLGLVIAIPSAWFALNSNVATALQSGSRNSTISRGAQRIRHSFVIAQIALAFVLLAGAGLLGMSLERAMSVAPGFRSDRVISGQLTLPWNGYHERTALLTFTDRLLVEITAQPGVVAAALATNIPLSGNTQKFAIQVKDHSRPAGESNRGHYAYGVTGDYFKALGIALHEGRFIDRDDTRRSARVCVVDEDFARHYWPQGGVLGKRVFLGGGTPADDEAFTVVGIVGAVRQADVTEASAIGAGYFPLQYRSDLHLFTVVRSIQSPEALASTLQPLVRQLDPDLPLDDIRTMSTRVDDSLVARRTPALLATLFGGLALVLAAIGTYGVLAYAVAQRRREIGVRMALGALPRQVLKQFLSYGAKLFLLGAVLGTVGAWAAGHAMRSILFNVGEFHPGVLAVTAATMGFVVLLAVFLPARRAAKIDPLIALQAE